MKVIYDYKVDGTLDIEVIGMPEGLRPVVVLEDGETFTELNGCSLMVMTDEEIDEGNYPRYVKNDPLPGDDFVVRTFGHFTEDRHG